ncbi:hypothetical protein HHK36_033247 [Tetracentron sinense]|uniref:Uncharacterized protein n=1 Tax=Tetracentron sinense TaxID=13715 RepID=A0A834Y6C4_TETSI|nr:hypothetical protein HHK36_033247 [Tetracentron sinense]
MQKNQKEDNTAVADNAAFMTSASPLDIRNAAAAAAASRLPRAEEAGNNKGYHDNRSNTPLMPREEFLDEEAIFDMPALLVNMAEGMLVSPPRINSLQCDDWPENSDGGSLWSYF